MNIVKCTNGHFLTAINTMSAPIVLKGRACFKERRDMDDQMTISGNAACDMLLKIN